MVQIWNFDLGGLSHPPKWGAKPETKGSQKSIFAQMRHAQSVKQEEVESEREWFEGAPASWVTKDKNLDKNLLTN